MNQSNFYHNDEKYKCCCNSLHITEGAQAVGWFGLLLTVMQLFAVMKSWQGELIATSLFIIIFFHVIWIVTFTFVVYGGIKKKAWAFIPFLILFGLVTGIICMYIFYICIGSIYETIRKPDLVDETTGLIFILVTPALLLMWIYSIVLRAFNYVVDSNRAQVYKVVPTKEAV